MDEGQQMKCELCGGTGLYYHSQEAGTRPCPKCSPLHVEGGWDSLPPDEVEARASADHEQRTTEFKFYAEKRDDAKLWAVRREIRGGGFIRVAQEMTKPDSDKYAAFLNDEWPTGDELRLRGDHAATWKAYLEGKSPLHIENALLREQLSDLTAKYCKMVSDQHELADALRRVHRGGERNDD